MSKSSQLNKALHAIEKYGFLLVFPIKNSELPTSLWNVLHPNEKMIWEWDDSGDKKVFELWQLREQLAASKKVVYGKFYQGRATLFSKQTFQDLLTIFQTISLTPKNPDARKILDILEMDSPLSTKQIKEFAELKGKYFEPSYHKALKELWNQLLVVSIGEIDDGAFPSLAHAATRTVFEDLWEQSSKESICDAWLRLCELPEFELLESLISKQSHYYQSPEY